MSNNTIRILSFDPGLSCCAAARSEYDLTTGKFHVLHRSKIEGSRSLMRHKDLTAIYSNKMIQLSVIRDEVLKLCKFKPDYVVTENAFYQPGRTASFVALTLCIHTIEVAIKDGIMKPVFRIPPKSVKKIFADTGDAGKLVIQEVLLNHPDITIKETRANPLINMTEHEADSIAVGYSFVKDVLPAHICLS